MRVGISWRRDLRRLKIPHQVASSNALGMWRAYPQHRPCTWDLPGPSTDRSLVGLSVAAARLQERDDAGALLGRGMPAVGLHVVPGHHLVRIGDEAVERGRVPDEVGILHGAGIGVVGERARLAADDAVEIGAEAI